MITVIKIDTSVLFSKGEIDHVHCRDRTNQTHAISAYGIRLAESANRTNSPHQKHYLKHKIVPVINEET